MCEFAGCCFFASFFFKKNEGPAGEATKVKSLGEYLPSFKKPLHPHAISTQFLNYLHLIYKYLITFPRKPFYIQNKKAMNIKDFTEDPEVLQLIAKITSKSPKVSDTLDEQGNQ